jgi:hypothetical protein
MIDGKMIGKSRGWVLIDPDRVLSYHFAHNHFAELLMLRDRQLFPDSIVEIEPTRPSG